MKPMLALENRGRAVVITLDHPPVNAIGSEWLAAFHELLDRVALLDGVAVVHLRSTLRSFSAGADLVEIEKRLSMPPTAMEDYVREIHRLFDRIEALPAVTFAEIGGAAIGGGLELALACDSRIAASDATLGLPEAQLGLIPGAGGTQRLTRLCGPGVASRLILGCEIIDGALAAQLGVVQWAVPSPALTPRALEIRERIAGLALPALRVGKRCIAAYSNPDRDGFALEIESQRELIVTPEARARVTAFVAERRARRMNKSSGKVIHK